eukprot:gene9508-11185_t
MESQIDKHTILVCKSKVPSYLRAGDFYRSLDVNDPDEAISVPADTIKESLAISDDRDLVHLLQSLRFWMVAELPDEVLRYVLLEGPVSALQHTSQYEPDFPYLVTLRKLVEDADTKDDISLSLLDRALQLGDIRIVRFLRESGHGYSPKSTLCAASSGNLDCLKCAQEHQESPSPDNFAAYSFYTNMDIRYTTPQLMQQ